jgi:hypothetical protein
MNTRRSFLLTMTAGLVALAVLAAPVIAEELFGVITKVDVAGKKLTVTPKGEDKDVEITVNDDTEVVSKKGSSKIDLEKLSKGVAKAQDAGKKGAFAKIEHEKGVASKIYTGGGLPKKKDN